MLMITGARGWEHQQWQGSYYPNEIAKDWHLTYYTKDYQTALAPVALWANHSIEEIKEFCSDVPEQYPLIFEQNEEEIDNSVLLKQQSIEEFVPNWVIFKKDGWQKTEDLYQIKQADIIKNTSLAENSAVFSAYSSMIQKDIVLEEIMKTIKTECKQYDVAYLYFDGELVSIDVLNTVTTLRKMLALD